MRVTLILLLLTLLLGATFALENQTAASTESGEFKVATHPAFPDHALRYQNPTLCDPTVKQISGYLDTDRDSHFFFWFFESRSNPEKDPLVIWLNGGPGCSSMMGLFMELGPCRMRENGSGTDFNKFGWNSNASVIFLDQPLNVGYSYGNSDTSTSLMAAKDVYAFLQLFLKENPKFAKVDFHVAGESYAGHYVPNIGSVIHKSNKGSFESDVLKAQANTLQKINLKSLLIGNGLTDPLVQYKYYEQMGCRNTYRPVLSRTQCARMNQSSPTCSRQISNCYATGDAGTCERATSYCNQVMISPFQSTGKNIYDIRKECTGGGLCYPITDAIESYLNRADVKKAVGAKVSKYESCNFDVYNNFVSAGDWMMPSQRLLPPLLEDGVRILVYADYICNWYGNKAWTLALPWSGNKEFNGAGDKPYGNNVGEVRKTADNRFAFLRVFNAGHMAPYDQPANSLQEATLGFFIAKSGHRHEKITIVVSIDNEKKAKLALLH
ncbi:uncharacterized protein VTP21DRAFT_749 [Calcarisporiella thermophila]|uniref:uncharacterized protein n=1 Tax=Calcarisporiella thermophila TaxID=911321 RepID=UPI003741F48B